MECHDHDDRCDSGQDREALPLPANRYAVPGTVDSPVLAITHGDTQRVTPGLVGAIAQRLDRMYGAVLAAQADELAAKNDLIAELRRRIRQVEADLHAAATIAPTARDAGTQQMSPLTEDECAADPVTHHHRPRTTGGTHQTRSRHWRSILKREAT